METTVSSDPHRRHSFRSELPWLSSSSIITPTNNHQGSLESKIEEAILKSNAPLPVNANDTEITEVNGHRGILLNKNEILNWNGPVPLSQYRINDDPHPEVIRRPLNQPIEYNQDISIRYLRPPTPVTGEIVIRQESESVPVYAPPLIIRKTHNERPVTPPPVIIREAPPDHSHIADRKIISVTTNQHHEYPPRRVITEIVPPLPPKPPQIIIEKWLTPSKQRRRVIYEGHKKNATYFQQRNVSIIWDQPQAVIKKGIRYLGVTTADPSEYRARYGASLRHPSDMPSFVLDYDRISKMHPDEPIKYSKDLNIDATHIVDRGIYRSPYSSNIYSPDVSVTSTNAPVELYGDLDALKLLDSATLEREGLSNYVRSGSIKL